MTSDRDFEIIQMNTQAPPLTSIVWTGVPCPIPSTSLYFRDVRRNSPEGGVGKGGDVTAATACCTGDGGVQAGSPTEHSSSPPEVLLTQYYHQWLGAFGYSSHPYLEHRFYQKTETAFYPEVSQWKTPHINLENL